MKKIVIGILLGSLLTSVVLVSYFNRKTLPDIRTEKEEELNYHTQTFISKSVGDADNDGEEEEIELRFTECYRKDEAGEEWPVGCPGQICIEPDEFCDKPYMEIFVHDSETYERVESGKIYSGSSVSEITVVPFGNEKLIVVDKLDLGAHSSSTRVFRVEGNSIVPVCKNKVVFWEDGEKCAFFSDRGEPKLIDLDKDGRPEIIEDFYNYSGDRFKDIILGEISVYEGGEFVTQEGENYRNYLRLFEIVSKGFNVIDRDEVQK